VSLRLIRTRPAPIVLSLLALITCLTAVGKTGSENCLILDMRSSSAQVGVPASWQIQQRPHRLPDGAVSAILRDAGVGMAITIKVRSVATPMNLVGLHNTLEQGLEQYEGFHLADSAITKFADIPTAMVSGTLLGGDGELATRICVFAASGHLWELTLTYPGSAQARSDEIIEQLMGTLRIRSGDQQQWAKLDTSQQDLLAYHAGQDSQQRAQQDTESTPDKQSDAVVRDLDSCLRKVAVGTSLDENNKLVNAGEKFPADTVRLIVLLQLTDAPDNTEVTVRLSHGDRLLLQRPILLSGSRKFAVTVYPRHVESFRPGAYCCQVKVNDQVAWELPIQIGE